ncbi:hypothetical protein GH714_011925 [Hevea brasiliensis]|uniref:Protein FAR1-RELATED SEQUENCE n=1 Tax=Hevea brasiliensis TaxID=3981 RepID=A0A6A6N2Y3_HEVBR|nr:hypothetical protein GH714_011925 [Hevea brasiliensis]
MCQSFWTVDLSISSTVMDSNVTTGSTIYEPRDDMVFDSHEAAYSFYKEYAKSVGFGTAKLSSRRSRASREFIDAKFSCIRYGNKQQSDDAINPRPSPKIGCKASMHVKRKPNGKWYIYSFVKEHNHELLPAQVHFFRSHRNVDPLKNDARIRRRKNMTAVSKLFGAYQNVDCLDGYMRNQHDKGRSLVLQAGDAQILLELFMHMQEENPKFFYAVDFNEEHKLRNLFWVDAKGMEDYNNFEDQFEKRWWKLLDKFNLREVEWVQSLYEDRKYWVPTFMRDVSFAGLSTTLRSESVSSLFDKYVHWETSMREFIEQYKLILEDRYEEEARADFDSWHETPEMKSPSPFEKQMSFVYTHEIFKKFQFEVLGAAACHLKKEETEDETTTIYTVKDFEDNQNYMVEWNESKSEICCLCRSFEYKGYLCRHAIVVLQMSGVFRIPPKYVLQRWTNAALSKHAISERLDEVQKALKQCANLNNSVENGVGPTALVSIEEENQCGSTSKDVPDAHSISANKASRRVEAGKEKENDESNTFRKGKLVPQSGAVNVGVQDSFHLVEMCDLEAAQSHNMVSAQLQNVVPSVFHSMTSTQFHSMAPSHLPEARLPR